MLAVVVGLPAAAGAVSFNGAWSVRANGADPGLVVKTSRAGGHFSTHDLDESDIAAGEDPKAVDFHFSDPVASGMVTGTTSGERLLSGALQKGKLAWDGPLVLNFGKGGTGQMTLALSDALFNKGLFGLHEGARHGGRVGATLTYDAAPVRVRRVNIGLMRKLFAL